MRTFIMAVFAVCVCACASVALAGETTLADTCEFQSVDMAKMFGWGALPGAKMSVAKPGKIGAFALRSNASLKPKLYMGLELTHDIDLTGATAEDKIVLFVKQNFGSGFCINLRTEKGNVYRYPKAAPNQWTRIELDLDIARWNYDPKVPVTAWSKVTYLHIYSRGFDKVGEYMLLDGFSVFVKGKPVITRPAPAPAKR